MLSEPEGTVYRRCHTVCSAQKLLQGLDQALCSTLISVCTMGILDGMDDIIPWVSARQVCSVQGSSTPVVRQIKARMPGPRRRFRNAPTVA